ncbi:MAG: hypothetical protein AMS21_00935 [Gemmatimonas sp. SG8_38_2]|nr:MAG: hypothetical protein AMS21_00935 [Gemmatimonas sp. SG8_38_2]
MENDYGHWKFEAEVLLRYLSSDDGNDFARLHDAHMSMAKRIVAMAERIWHLESYVQMLEMPTLSCELDSNGIYAATLEGCGATYAVGDEYCDALRNLHEKLIGLKGRNDG